MLSTPQKLTMEKVIHVSHYAHPRRDSNLVVKKLKTRASEQGLMYTLTSATAY